ncbi:MAG: molybdopterin-dependent oxidoreductase, partial [Planctomycetes bacterium]|nr:molybdopterin-dependent oxidoreductase [Planctomycetota bacterium]
AEVEVDPETGGVTVLRLIAVQDVGRIQHRELEEAQLEGDVARALARTLALDATAAGRAPHSNSLPRVGTQFVEGLDPDGPFGAKGAAGLGGAAVSAAVVNAVADAVGVRLTALPITPARVRAALRAGG